MMSSRIKLGDGQDAKPGPVKIGVRRRRKRAGGRSEMSGQRDLRGSVKQGAFDGGNEGEHKGGGDALGRLGSDPDRRRRRHRCTDAASCAGGALAAIMLRRRRIGGLFALIVKRRGLVSSAMMFSCQHGSMIVDGSG
ncbi:MAG: hypothetical protein ABWY27_07670, partial [Telluria sp.]